jgi:hypothetical protein
MGIEEVPGGWVGVMVGGEGVRGERAREGCFLFEKTVFITFTSTYITKPSVHSDSLFKNIQIFKDR